MLGEENDGNEKCRTAGALGEFFKAQAGDLRARDAYFVYDFWCPFGHHLHELIQEESIMKEMEMEMAIRELVRFHRLPWFPMWVWAGTFLISFLTGVIVGELVWLW